MLIFYEYINRNDGLFSRSRRLCILFKFTYSSTKEEFTIEKMEISIYRPKLQPEWRCSANIQDACFEGYDQQGILMG